MQTVENGLVTKFMDLHQDLVKLVASGRASAIHCEKNMVILKTYFRFKSGDEVRGADLWVCEDSSCSHYRIINDTTRS
jgi:hypothetical protein